MVGQVEDMERQWARPLGRRRVERVAETRILFVFRIQKAPPGSISQRQFYILGNHEAKVNDSSAFWGIRTQELTTVLRSGEPRGKS